MLSSLNSFSPAQLKVNLRPVWSSASEALRVLSGRFGDLVWQLLFSELQAVDNPSDASLDVLPSWVREGVEDEEDEISEEERTWRDPSAHKMRLSCARWARGDGSQRSIIQVRFLLL